MPAIVNAFAEVNSNQTTASSTYGDITGAVLSSANFTNGKKYLIVATASFGSVLMKVRIVHGSTAFADSEMFDLETSPFRMMYPWFIVWTAVSGEDIKMQFANNDNSTTVNCDFISLFSICLSDDLVEGTDWAYAESSGDVVLGTTPSDGASITITPGIASHDWLVLTNAQMDITSTSLSPVSRLVRSGEAASSTPECRAEGGNVVALKQFTMARPFTLGAASNTFKEQSLGSGTTAATRIHSQVFTLNLNKFRDHVIAYTDADATLSATDYATLAQTAGITPSVAGNVWVGAYFGFDLQNAGRELEFRLQDNGTDSPAGQTTANYQYGHGQDLTDEGPVFISTRPNLSAALHTLDVDASADSATGSPAVQHRSLWAVTMELPAVAQLRVPEVHLQSVSRASLH